MDRQFSTTLAPIDYVVRDMVLTDAQHVAYASADATDAATMRNLLDMCDWQTRMNNRAFIGCDAARS